MRKLMMILALLCAPAFAADEDMVREEVGDALFEALQSAETETVARAAQDAIWLHWMEAPDENAQALLDLGMDRMRIFDNAGAIEVFDKLILYAPDFPEVWNQRAFAHFRMEDFDASLADISSTLEREPRHFGALSGRFRILMQQGRVRLAQKTLREAVAVNPWLPERRLMAEPKE